MKINPISREEFAVKIAKVLFKYGSSHALFLLQQAFGETLDWPEAEALLKNIINKK